MFIKDVAIAHFQKVRVAQTNLLLPWSPFAFRSFYGNAGAIEMFANCTDDKSFFRTLEDVVVLNVAPDRLEVVIILPFRLFVGVGKHV